MYAIKARFDGTAIIPTERIPVTGPYEAIVTFTRPVEGAQKTACGLENLKAEAGRKAAERFAEMEKTGVDPLAQFAGCLKDVFTEDGVEYQRRVRDEWPD
jgi:hypothetical protein